MGWEGKGVGVYLCGRVYLPGRAGDFDPPRLTDRAAPATLADRGGEGAKEGERVLEGGGGEEGEKGEEHESGC